MDPKHPTGRHHMPPDQNRVQALSRPDLRRWLAAVAFDWLVICCGFVLARSVLDSPYYLLVPAFAAAAVLIGTRQHALGIIGHDGAHRLACRNRRLNDALTCLLCFWPVGMSLAGYRKFHFAHHRRAGTEADPESIHTVRHRFLGQWVPPLRPFKLLAQCLGDLVGGGIPHLVMAAVLTAPGRIRDRIGPAVVPVMIVFSCWYADCLWAAGLWFVSLVVVFWVAFRLRIWTEHTAVGGDSTHRVRANWWQRFFLQPHNTWCHWEHHAVPGVPCHNLPALRELLDGPEAVSLGELFARLTRGEEWKTPS